ncbi:Uncharacterised protein [Vibrio cholerae]|nr:Uncharacterised protein [Vibrio cholerae]CSI14380.1 Uncharacterised protein [Vibrio cholerae]
MHILTHLGGYSNGKSLLCQRNARVGKPHSKSSPAH